MRRRLKADGDLIIDDDEWEYRRVQPMHFSGPVNFRPYLDRDWFNRGGASEICLAITFSYSSLPFMPSKELLQDGPDTPSFTDLLSPARFVYRSRLAQAQVEAQLRNPLFHELHNAQTPHRVLLTRTAGLAWRAKKAGDPSSPKEVPSTFNHRSCVFTNGGASLGSVRPKVTYSYKLTNCSIQRDAVLPYEYPLNANVWVQYVSSLSSPLRFP